MSTARKRPEGPPVDLSGAYIMARIKSRIVECGDCWEWTGAMDGGSTPIMRVPVTRQLLSVRRIVMIAMGKDPGPKLGVSSCDNRRCVAPAHAVAYTRRQLQKRTAKRSGYGFSATRSKRLAESRRAKPDTKLNMEIVQRIRTDGRPTREWALELGVAQSTIQMARSHRTWKEYGGIFSGLMA